MEDRQRERVEVKRWKGRGQATQEVKKEAERERGADRRLIGGDELLLLERT